MGAAFTVSVLPKKKSPELNRDQKLEGFYIV
jgi:hypothetical protein